MIEFLNLKELNRTYRDELVEAVTRVIDSGWYVLGEEVKGFESNFSEYSGANHAIGVSSGLAALKLILDAWIVQGKLSKGDKVIVPANTFVASVLAITQAGLEPVFVDPDAETHNLSVQGLEGAGCADAKAVMVVHLYGRIAPMDSICQWCADRGLLIIEDAAQAHGAQLSGRRTGAWGDATGFSFYPGKNLGALGDGGAVTCKDEELADVIKSLRNYGSKEKYIHDLPGSNERLDEMQAAILKVKLKSLDQVIERRQVIANRYLNEISNERVKLPLRPEFREGHVWHLFVLEVSERDDFMNYLRSEGVASMIHYPKAPFAQEAFKEFDFEQSFPVAERLQHVVVSLPISEALKDEEVDEIIAVVNRWL